MKKQIGLLLLFVVLFSRSGAQNSWDKRESVGGSKRERAIGFSVGNRGYIGLGQDTLNLMLNDLWEFDPGTNTWTQKANFPGQGRRDAVSFSIGTKGYVGTGMNNADAFMGNPLSDFWQYDPATNSWLQKAPYPGNFGGGIYYATGFAVNGKGYICCGKEGASNYSNELWEYNPTSNTWLQKSSFPGGVRYGGTAFVIGNYAYYGTGTDENVFNNDFYRYSPALNSWTPIASFPGSERFSCSSFTLGTCGYLVFGSDGGYKDELWQYDPSANYWSVKASYPNGERRSSVAFTIGGKAYAGTGKGPTGTRRDFYEYTAPFIIGIAEHSNTIISSVYPNPMNTIATVTLTENSFHNRDLSWQLSDSDGRIRSVGRIDGISFRIERNECAKGFYILSIKSENKIISSKKIIIQ
ncbi:MAG: type sorting protein [Bacteroidota bacterium]|jgi:N-acetylneuraminic acid mutarotase|nr:type sorting protein [Bacteroidota bacterium]